MGLRLSGRLHPLEHLYLKVAVHRVGAGRQTALLDLALVDRGQVTRVPGEREVPQEVLVQVAVQVLEVLVLKVAAQQPLRAQ
jgi:hypothetical protein